MLARLRAHYLSWTPVAWPSQALSARTLAMKSIDIYPWVMLLNNENLWDYVLIRAHLFSYTKVFPCQTLYLHCAVLLYPQAPSISLVMQLGAPAMEFRRWDRLAGFTEQRHPLPKVKLTGMHLGSLSWASHPPAAKKPASLSSLPTGSFYSQVQSMCGAACCTIPPLGCEHKWLINFCQSSGQWQVSYVWLSCVMDTRSFSHQWGK